jgi:hypothetical protein
VGEKKMKERELNKKRRKRTGGRRKKVRGE